MGRLTNKIAIITGAARGIGRGMALRFAAEGCHLALCDMNLAGVQETAALAAQQGVKTLALPTDIASRPSVEHLLAETVQHLGTPDILINNAGIFFNAAFDALTDDQWQSMLNINLTGVFLVSQTIIRHWLATQHPGAIVNMTSVSSVIAFANSSHYCAAKAGVMALTKCIALEYGPHNIRCNSISPGFVETQMLPDMTWARQLSQRLPQRRMGTPEDVADVALFLASDDSRYVTGDMIFVDGGYMLERGF
ncbi:MAG: SDR family oxidoreductase [Anaerolineae bacterium]|nr:SDR family oxidoreductase [Anaerolineae bacterium]